MSIATFTAVLPHFGHTKTSGSFLGITLTTFFLLLLPIFSPYYMFSRS
ncbi:MAG: hypothetical protein ACE5KO_05245 [Candidatus Bathyarchaeia archaeon]